MRTVLTIIGLGVVLALVGCGGGSAGTPGPAKLGGTLTGSLSGANPQAYSLFVDGQKVKPKPAANGSFSIPGVPPGKHTFSALAESGMTGISQGCTVVAGEPVDLGDLTPQLGGQIAGMVVKQDAGGALTPLAGVEVLATSATPYMMMGSTNPVRFPVPASEVTLRGVTDDRGSYVIPAVPPGSYVVTVNVPGLVQGIQWVWVDAASTAAADFQLLPAVETGVATLNGTVYGKPAAGSPVPLENATVTVTLPAPWSPLPPEPLPLTGVPTGMQARLRAHTAGSTASAVLVPPSYVFRAFTTLTDAQGHYSVEVPSGYLTVEAWADGYLWTTQEVTVEPGQVVTRDFTLDLWVEPVLPPEPPAPDPTVGK
ncbi:MAG TPA: carboxypeptidase-like regulatory domain-containing protein [Armatimonadota bacterium]|jgi:hypothetical protein